MKAAAIYGAVLGFLTPLWVHIALQPAGGALFFGVVAIQLTIAATLTFRRTGLVFSSLAMALGAVQSVVCVGLYVAGYTPFTLPTPWIAALGIGSVIVPLVLHLDAFVNEERWDAWKDHMDDCRVRDLVMMRHIPDLRSLQGHGR